MRKRWYATACAGFGIHAIVVVVVMRICQTDPDPSIILFWQLVWFRVSRTGNRSRHRWLFCAVLFPATQR